MTLSEPKKLRDSEPKENGKLSEFQEELVQMAATLCGDHRKDNFYPNKLVEKMTVGEAVEYVHKAFSIFLDECEKAKENGADESHICVPGDDLSHKQGKSKFFASKFFSCLACNH